MSTENATNAAPVHGIVMRHTLPTGEMPTPGIEYYWKRTDGWKWIDGTQRWWEVFVVFRDGMNGGGGACIEERWKWNGSSETTRRQPRNLTLAETSNLIAELSA